MWSIGCEGPELSKHGAGLRSMGESVILQQQIEDEGVTVVGLQETNAGSSGMWTAGSWTVVSAASVDGVGGRLAWISTAIFPSQAAAVAAATNQFPFVTATGKIKLDICVLYAPHLGYDEDLWTQWWHFVAKAIGKHRRAAASLVVVGDINGRLGSVLSDSVGGFAADLEKQSGSDFHGVLIELACGCLPPSASVALLGCSTPSTAPAGYGAYGFRRSQQLCQS